MKCNQNTCIKVAIDAVGSQSRLALAIGVSQQMISKLLNNPNFPVSPKTAVAIEQATNGKVTRKDLRPDDWPFIWPEFNNVFPNPEKETAQ